jgi:hypothetical protein
MELDRVTAEIRPRGELEAVDLGLALVRRDFWRCLAAWWLAMGLPTLLFGWLLWDYPLVVLALFWWGKVAGSRMVLLQLSRRLFGEQPEWRVLLQAVPGAWGRRFFYRFGWARLSPFLPIGMAVEELENLRGIDYRRRMQELLKRGSGVLVSAYLLADLVAGWLALAVFGLVGVLVPQGQDTPWAAAIEEWDPADPFAIPLLLLRTAAGCLIVAISLTDIMVTGVGFGVYVNTRTWIEGWDVELAFRRMGQRLAKGLRVLVLVTLGMATLQAHGQTTQAQDAPESSRTESLELPEITTDRGPHEVIAEIKEDPAFKVQKVIRKVPKTKEFKPWSLPFAELLSLLSWVSLAAAVVGVLWLAGWLLWKYRYVFAKSGDLTVTTTPAARVVLGMAVTPESLPADLPYTVWDWWQQGRHQAALGLLYRGTISRVIEQSRVGIEEADTEGDCLQRVRQAGEAAFPQYFDAVTQVWLRLAYAGLVPQDEAVAALCRDWPFAARRSA